MLELIQSLSSLELVLWGFFLVLSLYLIVYAFVSLRKLLLFKDKGSITLTNKSYPPVSLIICAKNEAPNLRQFLPLVLGQDYPEFQVVVVNDCSEDDSQEVLEQFQQQYPQLYVSTIKKDPIYTHGKKLAITLGIKAAKYEHLVFTDADCYPNSDQWLRKMAGHFSAEKSIVLGVSPYEKSKGLLGQMIAYETLQTAMSYISSALRHKTYMGVGRNMAYTKTLFYENKGFAGHTHLLSGDDDLFINKAATKENVAVEFSSEALVKSVASQDWKTYVQQKRRHLSTGQLYKPQQKLRFGLETVLGFLFYASFISLLVFASYPLWAVGIFALRFLINSSYRRVAARKLNFEQAFFFSALWLDVLVPLFRSFLVIINTLKPQKFTWR